METINTINVAAWNDKDHTLDHTEYQNVFAQDCNAAWVEFLHWGYDRGYQFVAWPHTYLFPGYFRHESTGDCYSLV